MSASTTKMRGVGTGGNPRSHKRLRCLRCGHWASKDQACTFCGRPPLEVPVRLDEPTKKCSKCLVDQPISYFVKDPGATDGLNPWCRVCRTAHTRQLRAHKREAANAEHRGIPGTWKRGQPSMSAALEAKVWRLLTAAQDARATGLWRGRPAIRAYRGLVMALDEWRAPESERVLTGEEMPVPVAFEEAV